MIKENNPNYKGFWAKYDNYKIFEYNNEFYIKPVIKSNSEIYDIFDYEKELLVDFLMLGKEVADNRTSMNQISYDLMATENNFQDKVLEFVSKYGMIGLLTYRIIGSNIIDNGIATVVENSVIKEVKPSELIKPYFIDNKEIQNLDFDNGMTPDIRKNIYNSNNPNSDIYYQMNKTEEFYLVFSDEYSEKIADILLFAQSVYSMFDAVERMQWDSTEETKKLLLEKYVTTFFPQNYSFKFNFMEKLAMNWNFNSLYHAILLIFTFNETNDRKEVKMCKHCFKPFIAKNLNAEYDTANCRNVENVKKSRKRKK